MYIYVYICIYICIYIYVYIYVCTIYNGYDSCRALLNSPGSRRREAREAREAHEAREVRQARTLSRPGEEPLGFHRHGDVMVIQW